MTTTRQESRGFLYALVTVGIGSYFLIFTGSGLRAGFTHDDLMNLCRAWQEPLWRHLRDILLFWTPASTYRPAGSLLYSSVFELFGFDPLPFRCCCYALLLANLAMSYCLVKRIAGSRRSAVLAAILLSYHGNYWPIYINTGLCYDLLCGLFYSAAFLYYLRARDCGPLTVWQVSVWSCLYLLCLNSKEMAVTLPFVIAAYELLFSPPRWNIGGSVAWSRRHGRVPLAGAIMTAMFVFGRLRAPNSLTGFDGYRVVFDWNVYADRALHFLRLALYEPAWLTASAGVLILIALAACLAIPCAPLRLSVLWIAAGILPVAFIPQRGLDATYVPSVAFAMAVSMAATSGVALIGQKWSTAESAALFALALAAVAAWHVHNGLFQLDQRRAEADGIRRVIDQLRSRRVTFPRGARVLFLHDPFDEQPWSSAFLLRLYSRDQSLEPERLDRLLRESPPDRILSFDAVLSYRDGVLQRCDAGQFQGVAVRDLASVAPACRQI